jgi:hypothetical protein
MAAAVQAPAVIGPNIRDLVLQEKLKLVTAGGPLGTTRTLYRGVNVPCTRFPDATNPTFWCEDGVYRPFYFCENGNLRPIWRWAKITINGDETYRWYNNQTKTFIYNDDELPKMPIIRDALSNPRAGVMGLQNRIFQWSFTIKKWQYKDIYAFGNKSIPYQSGQVSYSTPYRYLQVFGNFCPVDDPYDLDHEGQPFTYRAPLTGALQISSYFPKSGGKRKTKYRKHRVRKYKKSRKNRR